MTLDEVKLQEERLRFSSFDHERALSFGLKVIKKIKERSLKDVGIRIVDDGLLVFQYLMNGKKEDTWLKRKEQTIYKVGHSGMYAFLCPEKYGSLSHDERYAICGGSFPLYVDGKIRGAICVSGLPHEEDHKMIVETLEEVLV